MATKGGKEAEGKPKTPGILRIFVRNIRKNFWIDPSTVIEKDNSNATNRKRVYKTIDRHGFDYRVWVVASSGFFTDSYNLFAANVIVVMLDYIYWPDAQSSNQELKINVPTLLGSLIGMLIFGVLSDVYGRRKLYGLELLVVIVGTLGIVEASTGYDGSMDILGWLIFWRFLMGIGIGAEYPLSAVLTAEFAPRKSRAQMMAAVFLMQSLGQLTAALVGFFALLGLGTKHALIDLAVEDETSKRWVDTIWRTVIGVGAFPAFVAIIFRLTIPESPRFTLDVDNDNERALEDIKGHWLGHGYTELSSQHDDEDEEEEEEEEEELEDPAEQEKKDEKPKPFSREDLYDYFVAKGSWRFLAATSTCWFVLDFAFYGLGINNPRQIARVWSSVQPDPTIPDWQAILPGENIYHVLKSDITQYIYTVSIGSVIGSLVLIQFINYYPRKAILIVCFMVLSVLFFLIGGTLFAVEYKQQHALTIVLYALCQFFFNLGPNALTFTISAEIFPTRYRGTCHGISAASGKLGSIAVQLLLARGDVSQWEPVHLGVILIIFGVFMALGSLIAWVWLPDVQKPRESTKTSGAPEDGTAMPAIDAREADHAGTGIMEGEQDIAEERGESSATAAVGGGGGGGEEEDTRSAGSTDKTEEEKESWLRKYIVPSKTLEELAEGWQAMVDQGQVLSLRRNLGIYNATLPFVKMLQKWFVRKKKEEEPMLDRNWGQGNFSSPPEGGNGRPAES